MSSRAQQDGGVQAVEGRLASDFGHLDTVLDFGSTA